MLILVFYFLFIICAQWITDEFIPYLKSWEESVQKRNGFTPQEKAMMLLARETRQGIDVTGIDTESEFLSTCVFTVKSFVEIVQFIFTIPGVKFFLSERISQDPLENFFGCQRQRACKDS